MGRAPLGLRDHLAFSDSGSLTLFRVETRSGERGPVRDASYELYPRVCRLRELLDSGRMRAIAEIGTFNRHVFYHVAPRDLSFIVVDGVTIDAAGDRRSIVSFDGRSGNSFGPFRYPEVRGLPWRCILIRRAKFYA